MLHWLWWHFGISGAGPWYGFWSGFGSDISELTLVGILYRTIICHEMGCWRPGHHYRGTIVCRQHRTVIK